MRTPLAALVAIAVLMAGCTGPAPPPPSSASPPGPAATHADASATATPTGISTDPSPHEGTSVTTRIEGLVVAGAGPLLSWAPVTGADSYGVVVSPDDPTVAIPWIWVGQETSVEYGIVQIGEPLDPEQEPGLLDASDLPRKSAEGVRDAVYRWSVTALDVAGMAIANSGVASFTCLAPCGLDPEPTPSPRPAASATPTRTEAPPPEPIALLASATVTEREGSRATVVQLAQGSNGSSVHLFGDAGGGAAYTLVTLALEVPGDPRRFLYIDGSGSLAIETLYLTGPGQHEDLGIALTYVGEGVALESGAEGACSLTFTRLDPGGVAGSFECPSVGGVAISGTFSGEPE